MKALSFRTLTRSVTLFLIANLSFVIYLLWTHLNLLQIDHAGHIASAAEFGRWGIHQFSDRIFLGYTHGLFYPPLEDLLINGIHWIFRFDYFNSYRVYLVGLASFYFFAVWRLLLRFQSGKSFSLASFGLIFLLNMAKPNSADYQGMSMVDLFITGLSNQLLSGIFFFIILSEVLKKKGSLRILLGACILAVISHIVVGFVCILLTFGHLASQLNFRSALKYLLLVLGVCAFYIIPFAAFKTYQVNSGLLGTEPWLPAIISALGFLVFFEEPVLRLLFFISSFLLASVTWVPHWEWVYNRVPLFHYSRFTIIALMITVSALAYALELSKKASRIPKRWVLGALLSFTMVFWMGTHLKWERVDLASEDFQKTKVDFGSTPIVSNQSYGRYFVPGPDRGCDSGLESILTTHDPQFRSSKGLFWESSYTNALQSSFLATLLSPPMVLDYFYYYGYSCEVQKCYLERYFSLYNVKGWVADLSSLRPVSDAQRQCYQQILESGTQYIHFDKIGGVKLNQTFYPFYGLKPKSDSDIPAWYSTEAVEILDPAQIRLLDPSRPSFQEEVLQDVNVQCEGPKSGALSAFLVPEEAIRFQSLRAEYSGAVPAQGQNVGVALHKLSDSEFEFTLPSGPPSWFLVKLSPQPGMRFVDSTGKDLPLLRGYPHSVGVGSGRVRVIFDRPKLIKLSYLISLMSLLALIGLLRSSRRTSL